MAAIDLCPFTMYWSGRWTSRQFLPMRMMVCQLGSLSGNSSARWENSGIDLTSFLDGTSFMLWGSGCWIKVEWMVIESPPVNGEIWSPSTI